MSHDSFWFTNEVYAVTDAFNENSFNIFKFPSCHHEETVEFDQSKGHVHSDNICISQ